MKKIDPRLLQAFVAVAREGSVSRGAQRLFLTQPAVSLQLKELGALVGLELFQRTPTGLLLTRDGAALLQHAEHALEGLSDFVLAAERMKGGVRGSLRIGTILDPEFTRLSVLLAELVALAPELETELHHGTSGEVLARLLNKELDIGFYLGDPNASDLPQASSALRRDEGKTFHSQVLSPFSYQVIAPPGWAPQVMGRDWPDLGRLPWVLAPASSSHSRLLAPVLQAHGLVLKKAAQADQESSMLALVRAGVGISLARDAVALRASQHDGVVIADRVGIDSDLRFVCLAASLRRPEVDCAMQALSRAWRLAR
ncbi:MULTISPECIES: LysR family transcriptional regulator [unclassified Variovorax]|uniref:LysR family transcriptional regulator n=1 Tax=unclassified Variovorax TaxID=663243 RepID=UPI002575D7EA|nr:MULTISPECIES: LysR family transcriptional regulator [unclassified Variovorax]MDM0085889.1 LysR family transcriptional regulator [Variovorax sp. J22G40]MDM0145853.1 LysR family transcriptional regulator [Variovorax sp. J2P1-31]